MLGAAMMRAADASARAQMIERTQRIASLVTPTAWEIAKHTHSLTSESEMVRVTAVIAVNMAREIRELSAAKEQP
jgi:hypothetical protein